MLVFAVFFPASFSAAGRLPRLIVGLALIVFVANNGKGRRAAAADLLSGFFNADLVWNADFFFFIFLPPSAVSVKATFCFAAPLSFLQPRQVSFFFFFREENSEQHQQVQRRLSRDEMCN